MEHVKTPMSNSAIPHFTRKPELQAARPSEKNIERQFQKLVSGLDMSIKIYIHLSILYKIRPKTDTKTLPLECVAESQGASSKAAADCDREDEP